MSNKIYNEILFNLEQKQRFLEKQTPSARNFNERILKRVSTLEEDLGKDLYNFNLNEIEQFIFYLAPKTSNSVQSTIYCINSYIRWAIYEGLNDNLNPLDFMLGEEYIRKFLHDFNELLFSYEQIKRIVGSLASFMDSALVLAIFEGVMGKACSELVNLTIYDINEKDSCLSLKNEISPDKIEERCLYLDADSPLIKCLLKSVEEKVYFKNNGNPSPNIKAPVADLVNNEYIFRNVKMNAKNEGKADKHLVSRKLKLIGKWFGYPYLSPINLRNSGMLYEAYKQYKRLGVLESEQIEQIFLKFGMQKLNSGYYNVTRLKKEFLNIKTIKDVYGDE